MKNQVILTAFSLTAFALTAQTLELNFKPMKKAGTVFPYIYHDGSFDIGCGDMVYSYTAKGELKESPYEYRDAVNSEFQLNSGGILIDHVKDVRYTIEPLHSKSVQLNGKVTDNPGVIWIEKLGTRGQQKTVVSFDNPTYLEWNIASAAGVFDRCKYAFFAENGDPVFVFIYKSTTGRPFVPKKQMIDSDQVKIVRLHLEDNSVESSVHLKKAFTPLGSWSSGFSVLGAIGGKLYFASDYHLGDGDESNTGKVDIWSLDISSGEEKKEHTFDYAFSDKLSFQNIDRVVVCSDPASSDLFFCIGNALYFRKGLVSAGTQVATAEYRIFRVSRNGEFGLQELNIPQDVFSMSAGTPPPLFCYQNEESTEFFLYAGNSQTDLLIYPIEQNEIGKPRVVKNVRPADPIDVAALFQQDSKKLSSAFTDIINERDDMCGGCKTQMKSLYKVDEDNVGRVLTVEYEMKPFVEQVYIRYVSEKLLE